MQTLKYKVGAIIFFVLCGASIVSAQGIASSAFREFIDVETSVLNLQVPTVIEIPLNVRLDREEFGVYDMTESVFIPYQFMSQQKTTHFSAKSDDTFNASFLTDNNLASSADFEVPGDRAVSASIELQSDEMVRASSISLLLGKNVSLPTYVSLRVDGARVVVARRLLTSSTIDFPETSAHSWIIDLEHIQPLRIAELRINETGNAQGARSVRFLAQPKHVYRVFFDADRSGPPPVGEAGNLATATGVRVISGSPIQRNTLYTESDLDADGIPDIGDNCVSVSNTDQKDADNNGLGDVCQDFDLDGISNARDNCINEPNANQADADSDGIGDVCDTQESRFTERYPWLPWVGIGIAALVILSLFGIMLMTAPKSDALPENPVL